MSTNEQLNQSMKELLATSFSFYLKSHFFHWNVTGSNFAEYHTYLGDLYEEVFSSIDTTAEEIRKLGEFAPGSLSRFMELSSVLDSVHIPSPSRMMEILHADNETVLAKLRHSHALADKCGAIGTSNYLEDRISAHEKHAWMLKSFTPFVGN